MINLMALRTVGLPEAVKLAFAEAQKRAEIGIAAAALARLRGPERSRKVFTGQIGPKRGWRGMPLVLPNGHVGRLICAWRGFAAVGWHDLFSVQPDRIDYFRVSELVRFKNPAAILIGSLKRGAVEQRTERKRRSCRRNGSCPPRAGSRPRGRPAKLSAFSSGEQPKQAISAF
jgi:hypothetical protein